MRIISLQKFLQAVVLLPLLLALCSWSNAGPLRERIREYRAAHQTLQADELDDDDASTDVTLSVDVKVLRNIAYGQDKNQRFDVYLPAQAKNAPVIFMVHGGGWRRGDKAMKAVVQNKANRWAANGFIFISTNYRMLPDADVVLQAQDVAKAIAFAQSKAASWNGDASKFILVGHSAGAHLVALLSASPSTAYQVGVRPWLGTVALDSAAFDVVQIMKKRHMRLYDQPFGTDPEYWRKVSPLHVLTADAPPILAVCSTRRSDSCAQAQGFVDKAKLLGVHAQKLGEDLTHKQINEQLGASGSYTEAVESFMASLDDAVRRLLQR
jgi:acetyl esterase/lipase